MTQVKFLIEKKEEKGDNADVFAFFPKEHHYHEQHPDYNKVFTCYAHIGQHSACHIDYARRRKQATKEQYKDLLQELIGHGYDDLETLNKK